MLQKQLRLLARHRMSASVRFLQGYTIARSFFVYYARI